MLRMFYHSLLFQMNDIEHVKRLSPQAVGNLTPHPLYWSMYFSQTKHVLTCTELLDTFSKLVSRRFSRTNLVTFHCTSYVMYDAH